MSNQHTPGPWHVTNEISRFEGGEVIRPGDGKTHSPVAVICDFNRYDRDEERKSNARLIAASPRMLELLKEFAGLVRGSSPIKDEAQALIAEVEGRS